MASGLYFAPKDSVFLLVFGGIKASATYQVLKVVNVLDNKTVFVTDGERSFNLPVSDVQGKVLR